MIQRFVLALALASAPVMVYAHAPATDSVEVHGKKPGFFKRLFHRHKHAPQWDGVHPELRSTLERIALQMKDEGYDLRLMEGYRSEQRQAALLASQKGVTQAGPGSSCHNHGWAADMVIYKRGRPSWDLTDEQVRQGYQRFGELAQQAGLRWGGAWKSFKDMPHVEMRSECLVAIRGGSAPRRSMQTVIAKAESVSDLPRAPRWAWSVDSELAPDWACESVLCSASWATVSRPWSYGARPPLKGLRPEPFAEASCPMAPIALRHT
ncbi:M15 family metallopeptidase [Stenotrophomonas maltophilia]|nr:M15 family metallopeptidase [Stenotrophomonas maltophilia]